MSSEITPSEFAIDELALWTRALREQREAEDELDAARAVTGSPLLYELIELVGVLRTRTDLLLAEAVRVMCAFRDGGSTAYHEVPRADVPIEDLDFNFDDE